MIPALTLLLACAVDSLVGDPRHLPHPVVGMGWWITRVERILRRGMESLREGWPIRLLGCLLPLTVVGTVYTVSYFLLTGVESFSWWAARLLEVWLISTTIAVKGLADAGRGILHALEAGDLPGAQRALAMVVGRDTEHLEEPEVVRGAVETVAENIVDAVTSPSSMPPWVALRWHWPIGRSTPWTPWWGTRMNGIGIWAGLPPGWMTWPTGCRPDSPSCLCWRSSP